MNLNGLLPFLSLLCLAIILVDHFESFAKQLFTILFNLFYLAVRKVFVSSLHYYCYLFIVLQTKPEPIHPISLQIFTILGFMQLFSFIQDYAISLQLISLFLSPFE